MDREYGKTEAIWRRRVMVGDDVVPGDGTSSDGVGGKYALPSDESRRDVLRAAAIRLEAT
jgi:hypothetical protein